MTFEDPAQADEAGRIREQLKALEYERTRLEARLREIEHGEGAAEGTAFPVADVRPGRDQRFARG